MALLIEGPQSDMTDRARSANLDRMGPNQTLAIASDAGGRGAKCRRKHEWPATEAPIVAESTNFEPKTGARQPAGSAGSAIFVLSTTPEPWVGRGEA